MDDRGDEPSRSGLVERVGAAIRAELNRQEDVLNETAGEQIGEAESNVALARAAIEAMREPTEAMASAFSDFSIHTGSSTFAEEWASAIDAAIQEEPGDE